MTESGVIPRHGPRRCGFCDQRAVWHWKPEHPPADDRAKFLCDDHAAVVDLDDLEELAPVPP